VRRLALFAVVVAALVACGDDDDGPVTPTTGPVVSGSLGGDLDATIAAAALCLLDPQRPSDVEAFTAALVDPAVAGRVERTCPDVVEAMR
jgi:hypothetical protein